MLLAVIDLGTAMTNDMVNERLGMYVYGWLSCFWVLLTVLVVIMATVTLLLLPCVNSFCLTSWCVPVRAELTCLQVVILLVVPVAWLSCGVVIPRKVTTTTSHVGRHGSAKMDALLYKCWLYMT